MPITISFNHAVELIDKTYSGKINPDEFDFSLNQITSAPWAPDAPAIWNFNSADFSTFAIDEFDRMIASSARYPQRAKSRTAIVATSDLNFGMAHIYAMKAQANAQNVSVFRSRADAERWLKSATEDSSSGL